MIDTKTPTTFAFQPAGRAEPVNIRTTLMDSEPWFLAADVVAALGLSPNVTIHVGRLRANDVRRVPRSTFSLPAGAPVVVISEAGLYALVQRSDKPEARVFQDWVNGTVLPSIRKTGGYLLNEAARETAFADKREAMPLPTPGRIGGRLVQAE